jgi:DNA repair exonuclease SbcCD ATPase subunit
VEAVEAPAEIELLQQRIARVQELEKQLQETRETYGRLTGLIEKKTGTLEEKNRALHSLQCDLESSPSEKDYQDATKALQEAQQNAQVFNDAQVALGIAQGRHQDASLRLKEAQRENDEVGPLRVLKSRLEKARNLFHRDALPAEVVAWYAQELVAHTETYLKMFEVNFQIIVTPELSLMAVFPDKAQPAVMLSGGEKNMLNISMRLAMADLFPSDLRVLVLDEVEVHLDPVNVAKLPILLEKVKGLARSRGLVVLFVSHHPCLRDVADHVIYANVA